MRTKLNPGSRTVNTLIAVVLSLLFAGAGDLYAKSGTDTSAPLEVMLQGASAASMANLVRKAGGEITHELHIINAVGATLSQEQLDQVLASNLVGRYIDDLSLGEGPEIPQPEAGANCDAGGALELQFGPNAITWPLYNKGSAPLDLKRLEFRWPATLGALASLSINNKIVAGANTSATDLHALVLDFEAGTIPPIVKSAQLEARFSKPGHSARTSLRQRDFKLLAEFYGDCATELIPGYPDNQADSYFPTAVGANSLHQHGITGKGVTVAVLDSGLWEHPDLARDTRGELRVVGRYDAINDVAGQSVFDESGHGTHMTSVLAHSAPVTVDGEPTGSYKGIAPDVNLVAVKAFNEAGQGDFLDIVRGIQWVVDHRARHDIRVLNLSFAARPRWHYWQDPINQAIMRAWAEGITVVAAAGNEGPEPMSIGSPGNLPYIITVGAVTDSWTIDTRNDDYIPDFSSRGPTPSAHIKPDIVAPGGHIAGLTRPGSTLTKQHPDYLLSSGEFVMTGTSQASALVSGIVALLIQLEPTITPNDVKCKLISSAELAINSDGFLAYSPFQQGNGYVSATRAVTLGQRGCGNQDLDIGQDLADKEHFEGPAILDSNGTVSLPGLQEMYTGEATEKGLSQSRRWGVKEHIERERSTIEGGKTSPIDWNQRYLEEKQAIENLATSEAMDQPSN